MKIARLPQTVTSNSPPLLQSAPKTEKLHPHLEPTFRPLSVTLKYLTSKALPGRGYRIFSSDELFGLIENHPDLLRQLSSQSFCESHCLVEIFNVPVGSAECRVQQCQNLNRLPVILWQQKLITINQLERVFQWLEGFIASAT